MNKVNALNSINFKAYGIIERKPEPDNNTNPQKLENDLKQTAALGKSQINFKGRKLNLNKKDLLFLSSLTASFGLSADYLDKAKQTLSEFLSDNDFKSMDDFAGQNYIAEQVNLADKLRTAMDMDGDDADDRLSFITDMVIERCEAGEDYFPEYIDYHETVKRKEEEEARLKEGVKSYIQHERNNDERLINTLSNTFELNNIEKNKLREIIDSFLDKYKAVSLKQFGSIDDAEIIANLTDQITKEFKLNEYDNLLISSEIIERIMSADKYIPKLNPLDRNEEISQRDKSVFLEIMNSYNIDWKTQESLYLAMKNDAYKNNYSSIWDLFNKGNKMNQFKETDTILNSLNLRSLKTDLLIDFNLALKNLDAIHEKNRAKEYEAKDRYTKQSAVICQLENRYGLSMENIEKLLDYFKTQKLDYSTANDRWKAVYDISDLLNISSKEVNEIITKINSMDEDELDEYNLKLSWLIMSKSREV